MLEDAVGFGEAFFHVAMADMGIQRHVGSRAALQMLQVSEKARGFQNIMDQRRARLCCFYFVENWLQRFVFGGDQFGSLLRHVRIGGQHYRHWLSDVANFLQSQNRLIVKCRAVIRVGNQCANVFARDDGFNTLHRHRRTRIDTQNAAMGD